MSAAPVEVKVGGQIYRVVASAGEEELKRLAAMVDARLRQLVPPGRPVAPQALLLAAMTLAHDLEEERTKNAHLATRSREMLGSVLSRIDAALATTAPPAETESSPPP
jgi:cell division protein ZapA